MSRLVKLRNAFELVGSFHGLGRQGGQVAVRISFRRRRLARLRPVASAIDGTLAEIAALAKRRLVGSILACRPVQHAWIGARWRALRQMINLLHDLVEIVHEVLDPRHAAFRLLGAVLVDEPRQRRGDWVRRLVALRLVPASAQGLRMLALHAR